MASAIDRWISKAERGGSAKPDFHESVKITKVNIINAALEYPKPVRIAVTGGAGIERISQFCKEIKAVLNAEEKESYYFIPAGDINTSAKALEILAGCDAAILAERLYKSDTDAVGRSISAIENLGKKTLGFVMI
ncbi:MAG: hypothetical protein ACOYJD_08445 [Christensenellales bacterium]|jgi:hypothetical protein